MPLRDAVELAQKLGDPREDLSILAEGNTSAREDDSTFWVKASGFSMRDIDETGFVRVRYEPIFEALKRDSMTDDEVREVLCDCRADETKLMPSVETFMHAYMLGLPDVLVVGHTHPTALLSLVCLADAEKFAQERLFPDEIVCCGPASAYVPYVDPGLPLAQGIKAAVEKFIGEQGAVPRTIWMQNHGLIALGKTNREVLNATYMTVKAVRARLGMFGAPCERTVMTPEQVSRIHTRPDEHYRQKLLREMASMNK